MCKKEKKMNKKLMRQKRAIVIGMFMILTVVVCSLEFFSREYRYVVIRSKWKEQRVTYEEGNPVTLRENPRDYNLTKILEECKDMIKNSSLKSVYPYLNWERLDDVSVEYCAFIKLSNGTIENDSDIVAKYYVNENIVLIMNDAEINNDDELKRIIIHELLHCLTYSYSLSNTVLYEGVAEVLAHNVCVNENIPFEYY